MFGRDCLIFICVKGILECRIYTFSACPLLYGFLQQLEQRFSLFLEICYSLRKIECNTHLTIFINCKTNWLSCCANAE